MTITFNDPVAIPHKFRNRYMRDVSSAQSGTSSESGNTSLSDYLSKSLFNELFEKANKDGVTYIRAKYGIASDSFLTAHGLGTDDDSVVVWSQYVTSGTKIARIKIGSADPIDVYAPTGGSGGGSVVSWENITNRPTWLEPYLGNTKPAVSLFTNDAGYLTQHQSLSAYLTKSEAAITYLGINDKAASAGLADSATELQNSRLIWGKWFDGTSNIQGDIKIGVPQAEGTTEGGQITLYACYGCNDIELDSFYNKFRIFKEGSTAWYFDVNTLDTYMPGDVMIKNVLIKYDSTNHLLSFQDLSGNPLNIVTSGALTAHGLATEAEIGTLANLTVSNTLQGKDVKATDNIYVGDLRLYDGNIYSDESIFVNSNDELYLQSSQGIFIESSAVSMDCGCSMSSISVGEAGNTSTITNIKVSGGYLYLTVGSNKYRASLTSVSSY